MNAVPPDIILYSLVDFARVAALLPLHPGRVRAFLGVPRVIHRADGPRVGVIPRDDLLGALDDAFVVGFVDREEPLDCARGRTRRQGDRLDAFSRQVGQLPANVRPQMASRFAAAKAIIVLTLKSIQFPAHRFDLLHLHSDSPSRIHS